MASKSGMMRSSVYSNQSNDLNEEINRIKINEILLSDTIQLIYVFFKLGVFEIVFSG